MFPTRGELVKGAIIVLVVLAAIKFIPPAKSFFYS